MKLFYLIYISKASQNMTAEDLLQILDVSKAWNQTHGLTGMLLYIQGPLPGSNTGRFMQVLEGAEHEVRQTFEKIKHDPRHHNVQIMNEGPINKRNFKSWTMGFESLDMESYKNRPGYFELNEDFLHTANVSRFNIPLNFLKSFYQMSVSNRVV